MAKPKLIFGEREHVEDARPQWQATHGTVIAGQAEIDETDLLAIRMEKRWGVGRLRLLADPVMREKFDRQRYLFNQAIWHGDLEAVKREAKRMRSAWVTLDKLAVDTGCAHLPPEVWEVAMEDGTVAAIVRTNVEAHQVLAEGRAVVVYTLDEIGRLLSGYPALARAKEVFPGASVTHVRTQVLDVLDTIHDTRPALEDALPF